MQRDIIFSGLYWVMLENIREKLKKYFRENTNIFENKSTEIIITNLIAGCISGGVTGVITLPLDVIKTRK